MVFRQIHLGDWPHGLVLGAAILGFSPEELTTSKKIKFEVARDDLDYKDAAIIEALDKSIVFALQRHRGWQVAGTVLVLNERTTDITQSIEDALEILSLGSANLTWTRPEVAFQKHVVWREDDNGVVARVGEFNSRSDAAVLVNKLSFGGHKQRYWIRPKEGKE